MEALSLYELNNLVSSTIEQRFTTTYWLQAELSEARLAANGHFYVEFIERDTRTDQLIAKARGTIWRNTYNLLQPLFERATGEHLRAGITILAEVEVSFHELYGFNLNIVNIDPSYTLGDMARKRKEILLQLEADGILEDNKRLPLPQLLNRIAVISSPQAAGYGDFCDQLLRNDYGLAFHLTTFPATMQGAQVESSVLEALDNILQHDDFDAVVIIRGGGATSDLSDFDSYNLAAAIASYPLPVIVGIGHDRDETVLDCVANTSVKTPTAAAAFLIDHQLQQLQHLLYLQETLIDSVQTRLNDNHLRLERAANSLVQRAQQALHHQHVALERLHTLLQQQPPQLLQRARFNLQLLEQKMAAMDPTLLLQRGYTMTFSNGRLVKSAHDIQTGDTLTTQFPDGQISSTVL